MVYQFLVRVPWVHRHGFANSRKWLTKARRQFMGLVPFKDIKVDEVIEVKGAGVSVIVSIDCEPDLQLGTTWLPYEGLRIVLEQRLRNCPGFFAATILPEGHAAKNRK